jgi:arabinan endo-1,5-alpha-L-arabinosidase
MYRVFLIFLAIFTILTRAQAAVPSQPISMRGYVSAHDPSTMTQSGNRYYIFSTGQGILSKSSADQIFWSSGPAVFATPPEWTTAAVPGFSGTFWAPDVLFFNNKYYLYYAVSTFGSQVSAIGLASNPTLDPTSPNYLWTDQGPVIQSTNGSPYNTIDPCLTWDNSGNLWLVFGSYWSGIYAVQLDPARGLRISINSPTYQLAYKSAIEASYVYRRGAYYYLFVNWGSCCSGVNSTYSIRVGRSASITGPYLDRNGVNMVSGGGTLFLQGTGKYAGPGHIAIIKDGGREWFTYHYYDGNAWAPQYSAYGNADFDFQPLSWTTDNWPVFTNDWSAVYRFDADAADDHSQYYGLLQNGASIKNDPIHGHVLDLNGTNQYVWLPPGAAYGQTFAAVVNWRGGGQWQRIFDFGFDTTKTVMLTPASGDNVLRCDINPGGTLQTLQWNQPLPTNTWTHVAVVLNGSRGVLYVNGAPVVTNNSVNFQPVNVAPQTNHLGRSKFSADPYFNGQFASFRVYGRALSALEIAAPLPRILPLASGGNWWPGQTLAFSGDATDFKDVPLDLSALSWQVGYVRDGVTNIVMGPLTGVSSGTYAIPPALSGIGQYVISLTATDPASSNKAITSIVLNPLGGDAGWSAYYPFRSDASDAMGRFNGVLNGGATIVNDPVRGDVLNLSGTGQFVSLPAGASDLQTFMGWVKWNGGIAWQRILDFGNDTNRYTVLTPAAANGKARFNISLNSIPGEQIADAGTALPVGVWTHVALVTDVTGAILYTNGAVAASNHFANLAPGQLQATNNYFGKSQWAADPYFNGQLSSVRIFSRPLSAAEITAPQITVSQPGSGAVYHPGENVAFSGFAHDFTDASIATTGLVWRVLFINAGVTNTVSGPLPGVDHGSYTIPTSGTAATNGFYSIQLSATDAVGKSATNSVNIFPAPDSTGNSWASFYPFDSGGQDASNRFNGTLVGGASTTTDPDQGTVLNLSGVAQYLSLNAGAANISTIGGWVNWRGGNAWQRIFDFGRDTQHFFFLTPRDASGLMQCALTPEAPVYNQVIETTAPFPTNQWTHLAVVMDGKQGILYSNGKAIAVNNSVNLLPSDLVPTKAYLGRSEFAADPYFNGQLDSIYLGTVPLNAIQLQQTLLRPPLKITLSAGNPILTWPAWASSSQLYQSPDLPTDAWTLVTNPPVQIGTSLSVTLPPIGTNSFYRLQRP